MPRVVLMNPQIPPNTGNIARTCAAMAQELHLIRPLGFELSDRYLKRAGLDYWPYVSLKVHENWEHFADHRQRRGGRCIGFSTSGKESYIAFEFHQDDWLLFGAETTGLPSRVLDRCDRTLYIPMIQSQVRSLNLSVSVAIGLFEALRQLRHIQP